MKYFFLKKSERRAVILLGGASMVRIPLADGSSTENPELQLVAEVDARLASRLTVALNEVGRVGDEAPDRMRWIVRDFNQHRHNKTEPWLPVNWHRYAIGEVPTID